jgi:hypothetical protein
MRLLLIALLSANLALFFYMNMSSGEEPPAPPSPPVAADKIVLLKSLAEGESVPVVPPPAEPVAACLEWGPLADTQLDNARAALNRIPDIGTPQEIRRQKSAHSWLVSVPGFGSRALAVNRANELRRQGINDISVLEPELGADSTFSLSLGIFSSEQGAQLRAASLSGKKISNIKITPRSSGTAIYFSVSNTSPEIEQSLRELLPHFADSAVQGAACPSPPTP